MSVIKTMLHFFLDSGGSIHILVNQYIPFEDTTLHNIRLLCILWRGKLVPLPQEDFFSEGDKEILFTDSGGESSLISLFEVRYILK